MGTSGPFGDSYRTPFVGRHLELQTLIAEAERPRSTRWLIVGDEGIGKTRLMHAVTERLGTPSRFVDLRSQHSLLGRDLATQLQADRDTSLIIFDGVDAHPFDDVATIRKVLSGMPRTTIFMTSRAEKLPPSWQEILSDGPDATVMPLQRLDSREARQLLSISGASGRGVEDLVKVAEGNPRLLLDLTSLNPMAEEGLGPGPLTLATILGPDGRPMESGAEGLGKAELSVRGVNDALLRELAGRPEMMYELSPRKFEELMAELYDRAGFEVELTRASGDGGVDLFAVQRAPFGSFLTVVDCKRHRADRPVGVGLIRQMRGTVEATAASVGVIATTSYFTKGARAFQRDDKHRLGLQDFVSIKGMLQRGRS